MSAKQRENANRIAWAARKIATCETVEQAKGILAWAERNKVGFEVRPLVEAAIAALPTADEYMDARSEMNA